MNLIKYCLKTLLPCLFVILISSSAHANNEEIIDSTVYYIEKNAYFYKDSAFAKIFASTINSINTFSDEIFIKIVETPSENLEIEVKVDNTKENIVLKKNKNLIDVGKNLNTIINLLEEKDIANDKNNLLAYHVANAVLQEIDEYSSLIEPDDLNQFLVETKGSFGGIGIVVGIRDEKLTIISPIEGTPAFEAGIKLLIAIPEHVPVRDAMQAIEIAKQNNAIMIGPNTPGVIIPGLIKIGIMPASPFMEGNIAVLSKSGTLLYEISNNLTTSGFGQNVTLGIGGDPINGTRMIDAFDMIKDQPELEGVVIVGEIGGQAEETLAEHIIDIGFKKPVVGYIAGRKAPKEKRMGHAGAIVMGNYGSAESKIAMFAKANIPVAKRPTEVPILLAGKMDNK